MTKIQNVWKTKYLQKSSQFGDGPLHWQLAIGNWQLLYCCMCKSQFRYCGYPGPVYEEIHLLEAISFVSCCSELTETNLKEEKLFHCFT